MYERTMIDVDEEVARVVTRPQRNGSAYEYRLHRKGGAWVLSRERGWYTAHALRYAERELDGDVMRRRVAGEQTTFGDFDDDHHSDVGGRTAAQAAD